MRVSNGPLLTFAALCMAVALFCQNVSLASGDYRRVLSVALVGMLAADLCCAVAFARGGWTRWVAVVLAAPSLFIVADLARRVPYLW